MADLPKAERVDIMLLLEGTFPYVSGGVSSWVNQVLRGFPHLRFGAVFIGSRREDYGGLKYELPENLVHLETVYLHDQQAHPLAVPQAGNPAAFRAVRELHAGFQHAAAAGLQDTAMDLDFYLDGSRGVDFRQFLHARRSWDLITELYQQRCNDPSFVDYFWTVRNMHAPVWLLAAVARGLIPARLYHTVSTGYAGFLGALLHHATGRPLLLSEHGIYTKERRIDIFHSDWIRDNRNALQRDPTEISYYRDLWIRFFETLGRFCYGAADHVVSLFEGARQREIDDGADSARTVVIPNGIAVERYAYLRDARDGEAPAVLTLLGRVVPIKDIKTFIRSLRIIATHLPEVQGWIIGPEDEDPLYAEECRALVESMDMSDRIHFKGFCNPLEVFPHTGLLVLSSVSEGLPLAILEAFAAGVPVVATDVGACRQLVEGYDPQDRAIGAAGRVVGINNPQALAEAALSLLNDREMYAAAGRAAVERVERYYTQQAMFDSYARLYSQGIA